MRSVMSRLTLSRRFDLERFLEGLEGGRAMSFGAALHREKFPTREQFSSM
jgi:hypothetical protein